jgi:hypothetical protein
MEQAFYLLGDRVGSPKSAWRTHQKWARPLLDIANPQLISLFFTQLPAEIQRLIYSFVVPSQAIHRATTLNALTGWPYSSREGDVFDCSVLLSGISGQPGTLGILGLPMACRIICAESIPLIYRQICFSFLYRHPWKTFCHSLLTI